MHISYCYVLLFSAVQVRARSSRSTPNDLSPPGNENLPSTSMSNRKSTGASRKSIRSQITIATSTADTNNTSSKSNQSSNKTKHIFS